MRELVCEAVNDAVGATVDDAVLALEGVTAPLAVREPVAVLLGVLVLVPVKRRVRAPLAMGHRNRAVPLTYSSALTVRVRVSPPAPVSVSFAPTRSAQQSTRENATTSTIVSGARNAIVADCTPGPSLTHTPSTAPGVEMMPRRWPSLMLGALNRNASVDQLYSDDVAVTLPSRATFSPLADHACSSATDTPRPSAVELRDTDADVAMKPAGNPVLDGVAVPDGVEAGVLGGVREGEDAGVPAGVDAAVPDGVGAGVPDGELLGTAHQFHTGMPPSPPVKV